MTSKTNPSQDSVILAQAVYKRSVLSTYDLKVGLSARFLWECSWQKILKFYNENISENHLDVGVGTGYFLDKCRFPVDKPRIALLDLNPNSLEFTSKRIQRYQPMTHLANVLDPIFLETNKFDSIGFNYVLHCLPGTISNKAVVFKNLKPLMNEGAILFGSTILGKDVKYNYLAKKVMDRYSRRGIFNNQQDNLSDLKDALYENFSTYSVQVIGCTALFTAQK